MSKSTTHLPLKEALKSERLTPFGHALAGAMGAVVSSALVYPLDTVKTRIQGSQSSSPSHPSSSSSSTSSSTSKDKSNAIFTVLLKTWQSEGIEGFFRGFSANMLGSFSMQFAYFFFHTTLRTNILRRLNRKSLSTSLELLIGALAGALAQIFTIPVSVVATRQQLYEAPVSSSTDGSEKGKTKAPSMLQTAQEIIAESGVTGLWTGLKPGLVLTVNPAITYGVFERLKAGYLSTAGEATGAEARLGAGMNFLLGVGSKTLATVVTYPYIFAKVRLQAKQPSDDVTPAPSSSSTTSTSEKVEGYPIFDPSTSSSHSPSHPQSFAEAAALPPAHHSDSRPGEGDTFISASDLEANQTDSPVPSASQPAGDNAEKTDARVEKRKKFTSAIEVLKYTYRVAGFRGWYQGMAAQILKAVLSQGILFTLKDQFERYALVLLILMRRLF